MNRGSSMADLDERLAKLSPEQKKLLLERLRRKIPGSENAAPGTTASPVRLPATSLPEIPEFRLEGGRKMAFSLLFFSGDGATKTADKYDFLVECVRFADRNRFCAVWTPERHFQTFGGLFPNPSVLSAALAMVTEHLQIRAGSVVFPMHHPIRLAEEWAVVDNLSGGRIGISLATGWSRSDFTIAPENYADRRRIAFENLQLVRELWAGKTVPFTGVDGQVFDIAILPKPIQAELPIWVTASGNTRSWEEAGEIGANVLTAMVGSPDDLRPAIARYRQAREQNGHDPATGVVTVMMHTFIGENEKTVKEQIKAPLMRYLETFIAQDDILREQEIGMASGALSPEDRHAMLLFAFERYVQQSGLLGSPAKCRKMTDWMQAAGVDEIACLVDFGVDRDSIRQSLLHLKDLCAEYCQPARQETSGT